MNELLSCWILAKCECFTLVQQSKIPRRPDARSPGRWNFCSLLDSFFHGQQVLRGSQSASSMRIEKSKMSTNIDRSLGRYIVKWLLDGTRGLSSFNSQAISINYILDTKKHAFNFSSCRTRTLHVHKRTWCFQRLQFSLESWMFKCFENVVERVTKRTIWNF